MTIPQILDKLEGGTYINEHFQSQLWRLDPHRKLPGGGFGGAPMHYVGRLETWLESWGELRDLLRKRLGGRRGLLIDKLHDAMQTRKKANERESSTRFKQEIKDHPEWHPRSGPIVTRAPPTFPRAMPLAAVPGVGNPQQRAAPAAFSLPGVTRGCRLVVPPQTNASPPRALPRPMRFAPPHRRAC